jgi:predicted nucleic acid-binding protein
MKPRYFASVLDACVLAPMPIADTLLRLAEHSPPFYRPLWSKHILAEVKNTLLKFRYSETQAARRVAAMEQAFPEASVFGYETLIDAMLIDPKDRHVLAAAVKAGAECIVSDNVKHFPKASLKPFGLECLSAESFLLYQYRLDPDSFINILAEQAKDTSRSLAELVALLSKYAPPIAELIKA